MHAKILYEEFKINLGDYHDLYVQSDTLLLAENVFENVRNKCIEIHELDPAYFLSVPGLAWQACLKKAEVKLELLTDIDAWKKEIGVEYIMQCIGMQN